MSSQERILKHVSNVEETGTYNYTQFLTWHYKCPSCRTKNRVPSGAGEHGCKKCGGKVDIATNGAVSTISFRAIKPPVIAQNPTPVTPVQNSQRQPANGGLLSGLFSNIASAANEANEASHGRRLRDGLSRTGTQLQSLDERILNISMHLLQTKCEAIREESLNWSNMGKIKFGLELQELSKKESDFNQAGAHALWLAGAWLESGCRASADAKFVKATIDRLLNGY
jgi:DNA-directed RNA polymerase subunit RPC12/RpoP